MKPTNWDREADVVILGYGYSGACSALYAKDAGAQDVVILEKMPQSGGYSIFAGGFVIFGTDYDALLKYYKELCAGRTTDEVIEAQVLGLTKVYSYVEDLCKINGAKLSVSGTVAVALEDKEELSQIAVDKSAACYPLPGGESLRTAVVIDVPGFTGYPWLQNAMPGALLMKVIEDNVNHRGVEVQYNCPAKELITDPTGVVIGVKAVKDGREILVKARRGVVIATGGFESNEWMKRQFCESMPLYSMGPPCNTGDGIIMAQKVGAALWHMWHIHGSYGFKFPEYEVAFRMLLSGFRNPKRKVPWIVVDKIKGERFMDEVPPAPQDTPQRPFQYFDADLSTPEFPRIPSWLVFDEKGRKMGPIAHPLTSYKDHQYEWSVDNSKEIERGWIIKADTVEELADKMGVNGARFQNTINKWNEGVEKGSDDDFSRPPGTMVPLKAPPFYAVKVWPIVSNTQGGPEHNARQQIVDAFRRPIPRLYAAGECGSMYGHLYQLAGNISETIISGKIAGENVAREKPWD